MFNIKYCQYCVYSVDESMGAARRFSLGHDMVVEDTHPAASLPPIRLLNTYPVETAAVLGLGV